MYLVWNRHDCFFRALAARYCAFVPWGRKGAGGGQGAPNPGGEGHRALGPPPGPAEDRGWAGWCGRGWAGAGTYQCWSGGGNGFQRGFEKEEKLRREERREGSLESSPAWDGGRVMATPWGWAEGPLGRLNWGPTPQQGTSLAPHPDVDMSVLK